jgi:hypothetical protein
MTAFDFLLSLHENWCYFQTREGAKVGAASNNELRRWLKNGAVVINGIKVSPTTAIQFPITSMVLFPKHPVTLR